MSTLSDAAAILRHPDSRYTLLCSILTASPCPSSQEAHLQAAGATLLVCRMSQKWLGAYIPPVPRKPLASESCGGGGGDKHPGCLSQAGSQEEVPLACLGGFPVRTELKAHGVESALPDVTFVPALLPCCVTPSLPTDFPWEYFLRKILTHQTLSKGLIQGN